MAKRKLSYPRVHLPADVVLGRGSVRTLLDDHAGAAALVFTSGQATVRAAVDAALAAREPAPRCLVKPAGEPTAAMIAAAAAVVQEVRPAVIAAVGGGSVLDWARLAWAVASGALDLAAPTATLRDDGIAPVDFVLVPTTPATGAEGATVAVYADQGCKQPVVGPAFAAAKVILDIQFLDSLDGQALALALCDAVSHAVEAHVSIVPNALARELAVDGLRLVRRGFVDEPDTHAREDLLLGAFFAGAAASHCSVGLAHAFAHTAATTGVGHAEGNALALPAVARRLADAGKLDVLAAEAGFGEVAALLAWLDTLVARALPPPRRAVLAAQCAVDSPSFAERMKADVCLRTCPLRLAIDDLQAFARDVTTA